MSEFLQIDLPAMATALLVALSCALVGNFLVLTRQSLAGDALSHVVLPGLVLGFVATGTSATGPMLAGAGFSALLAIGLVELFRRVGRVEPATALGVVFTAFFAFGILLLELSGASGTSFDVHHALFGNLEGQVWPVAEGLASLLDADALTALPPVLARLAAALAIVAIVLALGWKEFVLVAFDPDYATASGLGPRPISLVVAALTALVAVAAFEAVGVILVLAMLVSPAATGRMLTDRLSGQVAISLAVATTSAILGYLLAAFGPSLLGFGLSLGAAGTIALLAALIQTVAMVFGPRRRRFLA